MPDMEVKIERPKAEPEAEMSSMDAMQTFIDAVKAGDASAAHTAFQSYMMMCEAEKPAEPKYESFSG